MTTTPADDLTGSLQQFGLQRDRMRTALAAGPASAPPTWTHSSTWRRTAR